MAEVSEIEAGGEVRTIKDTTARQGVATNAAEIEKLKEVYSTNETKTSKTWVDGKPIYRKVMMWRGAPPAVTIPNLNTIVNIGGVVYAGNNQLPFPWRNVVTPEQYNLYYDNGVFTWQILNVGASTVKDSFVWIEYTKTVD